jgi:SHS family sialic acid transporter-like MFS transporter
MTKTKKAVGGSTTGRNATLIAALLGWMFDGFEMGLFPLIGRPALSDLLKNTDQAGAEADWFGVIIAVFLVGAASGGVLFGWLGDKMGRVRAMSLSIFTYAVFTGLCGFATEAWHIAVLRFIASLGMGGEWSLGVALVNEIWPGKSRAFIAGLIGAASNVGFLLVAMLSMGLTGFIGGVHSVLLTVGISEESAQHLLANSAWRFLMISGAVPALLIFFIRLFVPESSKWEEERNSGKTSHWNNVDLVGVLGGCLAAIGIIYIWSPLLNEVSGWIRIMVTVIGLAVCLVGFLYPVRQFLTRTIAAGKVAAEQKNRVVGRMLFGAGLAGVALLGTWGSIQWAPGWADSLRPNEPDIVSADGTTVAGVKYYAKEKTQAALAIGAIIGTILAALAAGKFGRRITYALLCLGSVGSAVYFYQGHTAFNTSFLIAAVLAGGVTASFYGFFPLYFPELFPTAVRATGQGFAFNFGRVIAAIGGLQTANLKAYFDGDLPKAGSALAAIYLIGVVIVWFGPETKGKELPD